jgi:hypothetical protein
MTKLERLRQAVEQLPEEMRDRLADYMLRYVAACASLRDELGAADAISADDVIARLNGRNSG